MGRWEPNAGERLAQAAMETFQARGYAGATVGEIAARAGLTERTFFRYFADKREVLFAGAEALQQLIVEGVARAPAGASPLEAVAAALDAAGGMLEQHRGHAFAHARHQVIMANAELLERERLKLASLGVAVAEALRARGVKEPAASLAAEAGLACFRVGFERWVEAKKPRDLPKHIRAAFDELKAVVGGGG